MRLKFSNCDGVVRIFATDIFLLQLTEITHIDLPC